MEKRYKHTRTGLEAVLVADHHYSLAPMHDTLPVWVVENSNDWELIDDIIFTTVDGVYVYSTNPGVFMYFVKINGEIVYDRYKKRDNYPLCPIYYIRSKAEEYAATLKPKVILTTHDGIDITDPEQLLYFVWVEEELPFRKPWDTFHNRAGTLTGPDAKYIKIFSSQEKRDEYILHNKPLLTLDEVLSLARKISYSYANKYGRNAIIPDLEKLAKSKME